MPGCASVRLLRPFPPLSAVLVAAATVLWAGCGPVHDAPRPRAGELDLTSETLDRPVALRGEWEAREDLGELPSEAGGEWRIVSLPGYFEAQGFPDEGAVWYRLKLHLPDRAGPLRGFVQHANNAHALYLLRDEGRLELLSASGRPATASSRATLSRAPVAFSIPADTSVTLLWHVANFNYLHGGPFYPLYIGSERGIDRLLMWRVARSFFLFGVFLLIGLTFLLYWWTHRTDMEALALSLLSFVMGMRVPAMAGTLELLVPAIADFQVRILLEAVTFLLVPGLIGLLLWYLFPLDVRSIRVRGVQLAPEPSDRSVTLLSVDSIVDQEPAPPFWRTVNTTVIALTVLFSIVYTTLSIVLSASGTSYVLAAARWTFVPLAVGAVVLLVQVLVRKRPMARTVALGTLLLIGAGVHDILLAAGVVVGTPYLGGVGFLCFILAQTYGLLGRFAHAAEEARDDATTLQEVVSERTRELRAATIAAHAANLAKSHFLSAVSHELRSPLASILGYNRILQEELKDELESHQLEFFDTIRASGERLTGLVNDILDVAKIEAGLANLTLVDTDARQIAVDVSEQLAAIAREKNLDVRVEMETAATHVLADPVRLRQVLLNLVSNAIKFTRDGEVVISSSPAELSGVPACAISVADTGPGISEEFLSVIFDRFTQDETLYSETQRGTGLGLSIARELVVRMNGTINVHSRLGQGSTFIVTLETAGKGAKNAQLELPIALSAGS